MEGQEVQVGEEHARVIGCPNRLSWNVGLPIFYGLSLSWLPLCLVAFGTRRLFLAELIYKFGHQWAYSMRLLLEVRTLVLSLQSELSLSLSRLSLSLLAPSPPRFVRDEATVFSRVDLEINGFHRCTSSGDELTVDCWEGGGLHRRTGE
eukprot:scaffold26165_cov58-Attheya_sp.AAC.1